MWRLRVLTGRFPVDWWGAGGIMLPAVLAAVFGQTVQGTIGTWFAMGLSGLLLAALMMLAKPFASGELQLVDRGIGAVGSRMLAPFARKAAV
jgi:hypothetical protein